MMPGPTLLSPDDTRAVLHATLRDVHGSEAELVDGSAQLLTKRGTHRAARYDVRARVPGVPGVQHYRWVGKVYERDDDARRVAAVLRALAASDCGARGDMVIPRVVAHDVARRVLFFTYEEGESVTSAITRYNGRVLAAIGRALAALHATSVTLEGSTSPTSLLDQLRPRIVDLCVRFPGETRSLQRLLTSLERRAPPAPAAPAFLHGDFGPANLLWSRGRVVILDFDRCTRGDPALDLGNLLTQLRRLALRKPEKLPDFTAVRRSILAAYRRWSAHDLGLARRVAWYEQMALLRKVHALTFDTTRHTAPDALRARHAEAARLLAGERHAT